METKKSEIAHSTEDLMRLVRESSSLEGFMDAHGDSLLNLDTPSFLAQLLKHRQLTRQQVIADANLERSFGYQIFNGQRHPRRNTLLRISLAMGLSLSETQYLLKIAQRGELYLKNRRDAAIVYCIVHGLNLMETEELLESIDEKLLT